MVEKGLTGREEDIFAQQGEVRGLEGRVVEANLQLQDTTLRAPYDGVIAERFVEQNQNVTAKQPIVRFQDVDEIEIVMDVPEAVMAADLLRAEVLELLAEVSGAPGLKFPARIGEVAQVADPVTRTFKVRAAAKAPDGVRALPGMTASVTMSYRRANVLGTRMLVPVAAVAKREVGGQVVWIIGADGAVTSREVIVGAVEGGEIEITKGLEPGDRIALAGVAFLRDGMKVRDLGDALGGG
jgi:RND family efflux transporter MFP subunit